MPGSSLSRHLESGVDPGNEVGRLCLSGNVQKHSHNRPYDQHNHNHKKMIDHFLMIMIMSLAMTMLLFFVMGTRKS